MRTITHQQFSDEIRAQGTPMLHYAFKCPVCGTLQSATDLIKAGVGSTFEEVETSLAFSCVGRFTNAGPHKKDEPPGRGCDWTLGGFLHAHTLEVVTLDGKHHAHFEVATPEEALEHQAKNTEVSA